MKFLKPKYYLLVLLLPYPGFLFAQTNNTNPFIAYANQQSGLMNKAYLKRDVNGDKKLIADFVVEYNKLSANDKQMYKPYLANAYYNLSCIYSILNNKPKALDYLDSSINRGFNDYSHLQVDNDMNNIRDEQRYKQMNTQLRSLYDYLYVLKKAGKYNTADDRKIPEFTYEPATDSSLVALRKKYNLDSIVGSAGEVTRVLNILHWVHSTINHDGQHESGITKINGLEILTVTNKRKIGVSCGELATVLNDCYLALGYKARKIYCFPKDSLNTDYDSHVINVVYLPLKKKWIWVDPTNDACVMNGDGELLSIEEVRASLVNDKQLIINPDANWNQKETITRDYYLNYYMAKNLYYLYCPLKSEYNYETREKNKTIVYVNLVPLDYFVQKPDISEKANKDNLTIVRYRTNNPQVFWQAPKTE